MKNFQRKRNDSSVDAILAQRLTPFRMALAARARGPKDPPFSEEEYDTLISALVLSMPDSAPLVRELENLRAALETGFAPHPPDLSRPETQLAWGAALLLVDHNLQTFNERWRDTPHLDELERVPLWQAAKSAPRTQKELYMLALQLSDSLRRTDVAFAWGVPGSLFRYDPAGNTLNADLVMSMIVGFDHARALMVRETGRSQLSVAYPPRMMALREKMLAFGEKRKAAGGSLTKEEYKELRTIAVEWELRNMLFEAAEGNCLNGYAGRREFASSLNHAMTVASPYGEYARRHIEEREQIEELRNIFNRIADGDQGLADQILRRAGREANDDNRQHLRDHLAQQKDAVDERERQEREGFPPPERPDQAFMNTIHAVTLSFFKNNGWFEDAPRGWRKMGVFPEWVVRAAGDAAGVSDFQRLMDLCGGPEGLEHMQPAPRDRWYGRDYYKGLTRQLSISRNEIIERIWDEYLDRHFQDMKNQIDQQIEQQMQKQQGGDQDQDQQQDQQGNNQGKQGKGKGKGESRNQSGQSQGGDDDAESGEGESQENDSTPGQPQQQGGDPASGKAGEGRKKQQRQQKQKQKGAPSGGKQQDGSTEQGESGGGGDQGKESGKNQDGGFDPSQGRVNKEGRQTDVDMDGRKEKMPDVDMPPESPQGHEAGNENDAGGPEQDGQDGDGQRKRGLTLQDIMDEMDRKQKQEQEASALKKEKQQQEEGQSGRGDGRGDSIGKGVSEAGEGRTLEDIAKGDWSDYAGMVAQLVGPIAQVARVLKRIQEKQVEKDMRMSGRLQRLPQGNPVDTLEIQAHRDFITKVRTGQHIEDRDRDRFRREEEFDRPAQPDIEIWIDGSGSMDTKDDEVSDGLRDVTPLESALLAATIIYEAAKKIDASVRIGLWGSTNPVILARPGDEPRLIGSNIVSARAGLGSGTELTPAIRSLTKELSEKRKGGRLYRGYTHIMLISDGAIDDEAPAHKSMEALLKAVDHVTMDFAIIRDNSGYNTAPVSAMEQAANRIRTANATKQIGIILENDARKIPALLVAALLDKINRTETFRAIPASRKRSDFRRAGLRMER